MAGQLRERGFDDGDVISGGVGPGVTRPQHDRQRFTRPIALVVNERAQRMRPETTFERRRRTLLLGMSGDQRGIQIHDQRPVDGSVEVGSSNSGVRPHDGSRRGPGPVDGGKCPVCIGGEHVNDA